MADTSQPTVLDYATSTQWRLALNRLPKTSWFCTAANIPGISLGEAQYPTPMTDMFVSGDKLTFETLSITFLVDEELQNYREIWDWLVGIGSPKTHSAFTEVLAKGDGITTNISAVGSGDELTPRDAAVIEASPTESNLYSDGTLIVHSSKNIAIVEVAFKDMFPTSLSGLEYSHEATDIEYFKATVTFRYMYYEFKTVE